MKAQPRGAAAEPPRPRTKPQDVRRDELMASGEKLFLAQGVAATSIDDIAAGADIAKGTFYLYFASKEDFVAALRERFGFSLNDAVARAVAREAPDDWHGRLDAWVEAGVSFYLDQVPLHDALFHAAGLHPRRRMARGDNRVVVELAKLLEAGSRAGAWHVAESTTSAVLLFNALHGAVDHAIAHGTQSERRKIVGAVQSFFARAVEPPSPRPRVRKRRLTPRRRSDS
ncbi:MAG TPA: TetR/AcrR family transcriptional regulator [Stellaceae bacterium]|nr:TetR/AcrR family transcriptional regulator [Stellaceae bacterium]